MTRGHQPKSSDPLGPPPIGGTAVDRRIYNVADPIALARVYGMAHAAAIGIGLHRDPAEQVAVSAVRSFVALIREPFNG